MKILVGDQVRVMVGKDKGKTGLVTQVLPKKNLVYVEGVGKTTRHVKPGANQSGERKAIFKPLNSCKVAIINNKGEVDRVGYKVGKTGEKTRFFKKTGVDITAESNKKAVKASVKKTAKKIKPKEVKKADKKK